MDTLKAYHTSKHEKQTIDGGNTSSEWTSLTNQVAQKFVDLDKNAFITCDDKDPKVLWVMDPRSQMVRWIDQLVMSKKWQFIDWTEADVVSYYRKLLVDFKPGFLKTGSRWFDHDNIPTMHPTIKR
eukprot:1716255-Karenia_brevis.AAC.1